LAGIIVQVKKILTKADNSEMAFVKLEDLSGSMEIVVFPKIYAKCISLIKTDTFIQVSGKLDKKDDHYVLLADDIVDLKQVFGTYVNS
jgi:DNA polymerase-3 subunit alpha